jgi:hypothetical protein
MKWQQQAYMKPMELFSPFFYFTKVRTEEALQLQMWRLAL